MTPESMIERVAMALAFWDGQRLVSRGQTRAAIMGYGSFGHSPEKYAAEHWEKYRDCATGALQAMRDPTVEMGMAAYPAWDALEKGRPEKERGILGPVEVLAIWQAMIDQALKP